jgi:hypothetical protein
VVPQVCGKADVVLVGIVRERLFGPDTIEEALRVVDNLWSRPDNLKVLLGINDKEFEIISKSISSKNSVKGKFMSPLVALASQYKIPHAYVGRNLTATSSRLSLVSMTHPWQFYKLLWTIASKSLSLVRTPQARPFLLAHIPAFVESYLVEGSQIMTMKLLREIKTRTSYSKYIAIVPMENYADVKQSLEGREYVDLSNEELGSRIKGLEGDTIGLWIPVLVAYFVLPFTLLVKAMSYLCRTEIGELANYETEGVALIGSWVRDKRRD